MDGNQLSSLDASLLEHLPNLSFLSLENNSITSLHGIQRVPSLLELYMANNQISMSRDVYCLKAINPSKIFLYRNPIFIFLSELKFFLFSGIDKSHHLGSSGESFSREAGLLSDICGVSFTLT